MAADEEELKKEIYELYSATRSALFELHKDVKALHERVMKLEELAGIASPAGDAGGAAQAAPAAPDQGAGGPAA